MDEIITLRENWFKGSIEYKHKKFQHLGSAVTNNEYSAWATTKISVAIKTMCIVQSQFPHTLIIFVIRLKGIVAF